MTDPLAFGVIGAGYFGRHYVRLLQEMPGIALRAVADRAESIVAPLPPSVKQSTDARDIFSDPAVDCVVIATPVASHAALVAAALAAGKHVLVEKPMTATLREAEELQTAVEKSGRIFMIGHQYLYHDHLRALKERLDQGMLGTPRYVFAEHLFFGPIRSDTGCFWESAVHECSVLDYLFMPGDAGDARGMRVDFRGAGRDDFASVGVIFENGLTAAIVVSWFAPEKVRRMTIAGDKGMAVFDDRREEKLKIFLHPYPTERPDGHASRFMAFAEGEVITPAVDAREPLRNQLEHFISCVRNGTEPLSGITHGLRVMRMLDTISRAVA